MKITFDVPGDAELVEATQMVQDMEITVEEPGHARPGETIKMSKILLSQSQRCYGPLEHWGKSDAF